MPVKIKNIAERCGLSTATVGYILGGSTKYKFKSDTIALVKRTAEEMNYRPNLLAKNLREQKNKIILCIVGYACRHVDVEQLKTLEQEFGKRGYSLIIQFLVDLPDTTKVEFLSKIINWPAGIVVLELGIRDPEMMKKAVKLFENAPPTVALTEAVPGTMIDYISIDWRSCKQSLVAWLKKENVKNAVCCMNRYEHEVGCFSPFIKYASENGICITELYTDARGAISNYFEQGFLLAKMLRDPLPDAIYCVSDEMAFSIMEDLRDRGIRIPEDVKVIGGGDSEFCQWLKHPIPVMIHDIPSVAATAAEYLTSRIERGEHNVGTGKNVAKIEQDILQRETH